MKKLDYAEREIMPVRLEYVKLKRQLEATEDKYLKMTRSQHEGLDQNQITIDNRVRYFIILISHLVMDGASTMIDKYRIKCFTTEAMTLNFLGIK